MSTWDPENPANTPADLRDKLEEANRLLDDRDEAHAAELAAKDREMAFLRAGVDVDSDAGRIFAKGYEGDLSVDAIRAAASGFNLTPAQAAAPDPSTQTPTDPELSAEEQQLLDAGAQINGNPPPPEPPVADPREVAVQIAEQAMADGATRDEAIGYGFNALVNAGAQGDERAIAHQKILVQQEV